MWVFGIFFLLFLIILFGSSFFADRIGNAVISELNQNLKHDIIVDNYDLTLVRYFPNAAVTLHNIKVPDSNNKNTLLEANELAFRFGLFSLFGSKIKISSVVVNDGALFVEVDRNGKPNYDIFIESETDTESESGELSIKLKEAKLDDVELIYSDQQAKQDLKMNIEKAKMSGEFSGDRFALTSDAQFVSEFFETADGRYFLGKNISYRADVDVDLKNENYQFKDFLLTLEENKFSIGGAVKKEGKGYLYDLTFDGKDCTLQSLLGLLPEGYMEDLVGLKSKGDFTFEGTVKGKSGKQQPAINVKLGLNDGKISGPQLDSPFRDLTFNATYTNGKARTNESSVLEIQDFKGYIQREMVELKLKVKDLNRPYIDASFSGSIPLDAVHGFLGSEMINGGGGDIEVQDLEIHGYYDEMINPNLIYKVRSKGSIEFDDAMLKINKEKVTIDRGKLLLDGNNLSIQGLKIEGVGSEILIDGSFRNLIPVMLSDSINSKDAQLIFDSKLTADKIDIERWLNISSVPDKESVEKEVYDSLKAQQYADREAFTNFLDGTFECNIKEFSYGKIKGSNFNGKMTFRNGELIVDGDVVAMDGSFDLDGIIYMDKEPELKAKLACKDIDGNQFFKQTDNFGQDVLTDKNIKGRIDANIMINAYWDSAGEFLTDKLHVLSDAHIKNGELIKFEMLESFSKFVKLKDLQHIHFTDTKNLFEIKNGVFVLPVMLIQSNALNLTLSGKHSFEQEIDYNVKVNAGQVVVKKLFKRAGSKPIKAKNGWFNLYYKISGDIENYEMESAKKMIKREFEESERRKLRIQNQLVKEFGVIAEVTEITELDDDEASTAE